MFQPASCAIAIAGVVRVTTGKRGRHKLEGFRKGALFQRVRGQVDNITLEQKERVKK